MTDTTDRPADAPPPPPYPEPPHGDEERGELATGAWRLGAIICAIVALGLWAGFSLVIVILALVVMIFFHELGHYLMAKRAGMKVTEFFIGFGPRLWSYRRGETEYGVKAIPAGAYVRIIGMTNLEEVPPQDEMRTYRQKSYPARLSVAVAGSAMHFLMATACIFLLLAVTGVRGGTVLDLDELERKVEDIEAGPWIVDAISADSAAEAAGIRRGDVVVSIEGEQIDDWEELGEIVRARPGEQVEIVLERDGEQVTVETELGANAAGEGFLGIGPEFEEDLAVERVPVPQALVQSVEELGLGLKLAGTGLAQIFTGGIDDFAAQVAEGGDDTATQPEPGSGTPPPASGSAEENENRFVSIVGATRLGTEMTESGLDGLLLFLVNINIFVGLFNLVPLLPLDGGHVAVATYERIRSRNGRRYMADVSRLLPLTYAVVMVLVVIGLSSLYLDIVDPISLGG